MERINLIRNQAATHQCPIAYTNLVGGQDELVFDGDSMLVDKQGQLQYKAPSFTEGVFVQDWQIAQPLTQTFPLTEPAVEAVIYQAIVMGLRDYVHKNGFKGVLLGLSGGIDSALTLALAVDALGAEQVEAVMMPFRYTASISIEDAKAQAQWLGVKYREISIEPIFHSFIAQLTPEFEAKPSDVTEENLQARIRGMLLMSLSNKHGKLLLSTSNKSESAVGYATLYGDMAGAFAPIKDVYKTLVYRLASYRNSLGQAIPERVITRPPSAELAPGQVDQDSLPAYEELDGILQRFIEGNEALESIVAAGFAQSTVKRVVNLVLLSEYKRNQAAPGVRITRRGFGKDWRYPLTSAWRKNLPLSNAEDTL
jgi:NAD+ synthase (glutamine-hydrolysing)